VQRSFIVNSSVNEPVLKISLLGVGEYYPPLTTENVTLLMDDFDAVITWDAVTENIHNQPITPDYYIVWFSGSMDPDVGPYYFLALTPDLSHTHNDVGLHSPFTLYRVTAYKYYGPGVCDLSALHPGMSEVEVRRVLESRGM
jgi:hypothetical protein